MHKRFFLFTLLFGYDFTPERFVSILNWVFLLVFVYGSLTLDQKFIVL
jgi:hypothetical protein